MKFFKRFICSTFLFVCATSANASLLQYVEFYLGEDIEADPAAWIEILFPTEAGCVSGTPFFLDPFDCSDTDFGEDTATPDEIIITGSIGGGPVGTGTFNAGFWNINSEDWLLDIFAFGFTTADEAPVGMAGADFPFAIPFPEGDPVSTLGVFRATVLVEGEPTEFGGVTVASPVHVSVPSSLALISIGLIGFWLRRGASGRS